MNIHPCLFLVLVSLSILSSHAQDADDESGQDRTLGIFRHRNRYGNQGLFGGLLGSFFGGPSYNPYFNPGFGGYYGGGFNPYFGGQFGGPGFRPGLGAGYAPGFGGYRRFPGGYEGN